MSRGCTCTMYMSRGCTCTSSCLTLQIQEIGSCPMARQGYLLHHYQQAGLDISLTMQSPSQDIAIVDMFHQVIQSALWRNVDGRIPPAWDPERFGWDKDIPNRTLNPTTLPAHCKAAPDYILDMIKCGCKSELPCSSKKCSCRYMVCPAPRHVNALV